MGTVGYSTKSRLIFQMILLMVQEARLDTRTWQMASTISTLKRFGGSRGEESPILQ